LVHAPGSLTGRETENSGRVVPHKPDPPPGQSGETLDIDPLEGNIFDFIVEPPAE